MPDVTAERVCEVDQADLNNMYFEGKITYPQLTMLTSALLNGPEPVDAQMPFFCPLCGVIMLRTPFAVWCDRHGGFDVVKLKGLYTVRQMHHVDDRRPTNPLT